MSYTENLVIVGVGLASAAIAWFAVAVLVWLAPAIGLIDRPNERSSHSRPTPRGGGIGFVLAVLVVFAGLKVFEWFRPGTRPDGMFVSFVAYLSAVLFIAAVSLRDDFKSLGAGIRLLCQLMAAAVVVAGIGAYRQLSVPLSQTIDLGWLGWPFTLIWIVGLTNVYNFMDGIDGIAGVQGLVAALAWTEAGIWLGKYQVAALGIMIAGGCAGFLFHNWAPAKIFMGDVGSAFLGFSFAALPLLFLRERGISGRLSHPGAVPAFALLAVWPFVGDGFLTFVRRALNREPIFLPHRSHLYQRLVQTGWSHSRVAVFYAGWCLLSLLVALMWLENATGGQVAAALFPPVSLGIVLATVVIQERRAQDAHA